MNRNALLSQTEATAFENQAREILLATEGKNWEKKFSLAKEGKKKGRTKTIEFSLPVLATIITKDLWYNNGMPKIQKVKLANMILKKVHDDNIEHVVTLLRSFLSDSEMNEYMRNFRKEQKDAPEKVHRIVSQLLTAAWFLYIPRQSSRGIYILFNIKKY